MKTLLNILPVIGLLLFYSCDKEENPMYPKELSDNELINTFYPGEPTLYEDTITFGSNTNVNKNVLIEDYTGHTCNNCPPAAIVAKGLEDANPDRVFVLSVHAGGAENSFQLVSSNFPTDFTTDAGTNYTVDIDGFFGNPSGMVNRGFLSGSSSLWMKSSDWGSKTSELLSANDLKVNLQIQAEFYPETKGVFVHYEIEALQDLGSNAKILVCLAEHKVISPQKLQDQTTNENYEHHNVLSGILSNSNYGDIINSGGLLTGEKSQGLLINGLDEINSKRIINEDGENDLVVFALIVDGTTLEILQVISEDVELNKQL